MQNIRSLPSTPLYSPARSVDYNSSHRAGNNENSYNHLKPPTKAATSLLRATSDPQNSSSRSRVPPISPSIHPAKSSVFSHSTAFSDTALESLPREFEAHPLSLKGAGRFWKPNDKKTSWKSHLLARTRWADKSTDIIRTPVTPDMSTFSRDYREKLTPPKTPDLPRSAVGSHFPTARDEHHTFNPKSELIIHERRMRTREQLEKLHGDIPEIIQDTKVVSSDANEIDTPDPLDVESDMTPATTESETTFFDDGAGSETDLESGNTSPQEIFQSQSHYVNAINAVLTRSENEAVLVQRGQKLTPQSPPTVVLPSWNQLGGGQPSRPYYPITSEIEERETLSEDQKARERSQLYGLGLYRRESVNQWTEKIPYDDWGKGIQKVVTQPLRPVVEHSDAPIALPQSNDGLEGQSVFSDLDDLVGALRSPSTLSHSRYRQVEPHSTLPRSTNQVLPNTNGRYSDPPYPVQTFRRRGVLHDRTNTKSV